MSMNLLKISITLFFVIVFSSCASFKTSNSADDKIVLSKDNLHLINGVYKTNEEARHLPIDCFWSREEFYLTQKYNSMYNKLVKEKTPVFITLKVRSDKRIQATISTVDSILKTVIIRGKIKNGFFEQKRKLNVLPVVIFNSFQNSKFRIGLLEDDTIAIDFKRVNFGTVYFLSPYSNNTSYVTKLHRK